MSKAEAIGCLQALAITSGMLLGILGLLTNNTNYILFGILLMVSNK